MPMDMSKEIDLSQRVPSLVGLFCSRLWVHTPSVSAEMNTIIVINRPNHKFSC